MKIYFCCPVRNVIPEYKDGLDAQVEFLEKQGHEVYYPHRDTNQDDDSGLRICMDNRAAIENCDEVFVAWDGKSQGVLFDLGMAFALNKPVMPVVGYFPNSTPYKSFQNMVRAWNECNPYDDDCNMPDA
jgi:nucleoside 2-deoxyribosyltransferase